MSTYNDNRPSQAPQVPEGWAVRWNDEYKEWFYVNVYTKKSQWDKPTHPVYAGGAPSDAPPSYQSSSAELPAREPKKTGLFGRKKSSTQPGGPDPYAPDHDHYPEPQRSQMNSGYQGQQGPSYNSGDYQSDYNDNGMYDDYGNSNNNVQGRGMMGRMGRLGGLGGLGGGGRYGGGGYNSGYGGGYNSYNNGYNSGYGGGYGGGLGGRMGGRMGNGMSPMAAGGLGLAGGLVGGMLLEDVIDHSGGGFMGGPFGGYGMGMGPMGFGDPYAFGGGFGGGPFF